MTGGHPRMSGRQLRRAKQLIRRLCANYENGNCLLLDDGDTYVCPQAISYSLMCRYFCHAILPTDPALYAEIVKRESSRRCKRCGIPFIPTSGRSLYCGECSRIQEKKRKAEWARRHRAERGRLSPEKP